MRKNADQNNSEYDRFSCSVWQNIKKFLNILSKIELNEIVIPLINIQEYKQTLLRLVIWEICKWGRNFMNHIK